MGRYDLAQFSLTDIVMVTETSQCDAATCLRHKTQNLFQPDSPLFGLCRSSEVQRCGEKKLRYGHPTRSVLSGQNRIGFLRTIDEPVRGGND